MDVSNELLHMAQLTAKDEEFHGDVGGGGHVGGGGDGDNCM